jgi:hypothetical protein
MKTIALLDIKDTGPRRDHGTIEFKELKESIERLGLLEPLVINQNQRLLCGRRRFQALRELGIKEVEFKLVKTKDILEEFDISLDENIKRKNLTPIEEAQALEARKEIYERLHPETKRGGDRKSDRIKSENLRFDRSIIECLDCHSQETQWLPVDEPPDNDSEYLQCSRCGYVRRGGKEPLAKNVKFTSFTENTSKRLGMSRSSVEKKLQLARR